MRLPWSQARSLLRAFGRGSDDATVSQVLRAGVVMGAILVMNFHQSRVAQPNCMLVLPVLLVLFRKVVKLAHNLHIALVEKQALKQSWFRRKHSRQFLVFDPSASDRTIETRINQPGL